MMLKRIALAALLALSASASHGQDRYPNRPVKIIVPTPAGGPVDVVARLTAQYLSGTIGQSVVVDNRPGAGNTLGSKEAARAEPDGYTLLFGTSAGLTINPALSSKLPYNALKDFAPVGMVMTSFVSVAVPKDGGSVSYVRKGGGQPDEIVWTLEIKPAAVVQLTLTATTVSGRAAMVG